MKNKTKRWRPFQIRYLNLFNDINNDCNDIDFAVVYLITDLNLAILHLRTWKPISFTHLNWAIDHYCSAHANYSNIQVLDLVLKN